MKALLLLGLCLGLSALARADTPVEWEASTVTIRNVTFKGADQETLPMLEKRTLLKKGQRYTPMQMAFATGIIKSIYRDKGYWDVAASTEVALVHFHQVDLLFNIAPGGQYHVHSIVVEGNRILSRHNILRELDMKPGDVLNQSKIYDGYKQLFLTGYFEKIDLHYSSATAHQTDILIQVKERPTQFILGSLGYGTEVKERASIGYENNDFFGNARRFNAKATYSGFLTNPRKYRTTILETNLAQPYIFDTRLEAQTSISEAWQNREAYDTQATTWRSGISRRFGPNLSATLKYRYEGTQILRINPGDAGTTAPFVNVSAVGPGFAFDSTLDHFLPQNGWRLTGLYEEGIKYPVGDVEFNKIQLQVGRYDTFWNSLTFYTALQTGLIHVLHPEETLPIFERFNLGGGNSVRAYSERDLGPKDSEGSPIGGEAYAAGTLEARHRLYKKIFGVLFLDGGQLWARPNGAHWPLIQARSLGDFKYGVGTGLRVQTPIGPVRLEAGYKLNPPAEFRSFMDRIAIHFSIGEAF